MKIAVCGAAGRMGQRVIALAAQDSNIQVVGAVDRQPAAIEGAVSVGSQWDFVADVVIDFSTPAGTDCAVQFCGQHRTPLVVATTGLSDRQQERIRQLSEDVAVVLAPNMSRAVNLTMRLTEIAAQALAGAGTVDVEIIERHHRHKADAPSGTALRFGQLVASHMGQTRHVHGRHGTVGQRSADEIGYHAIRAGDNPGQHTIVFAIAGETIELTVAASNRDCYAMGALAAARFLLDRPPGLYSMYDVLGL